MNILRFPDTPRTEDRKGGPAEAVRAAGPQVATGPADARILRSISVLNGPVLDAVMSRRHQARDVLAAFRAEWAPPRARAPRPANDATTR
ncbi:hypothetical protein D3218_03590 [Aureimonas flava]|uniref:Uncharacterized protein n=1 Tax=Aureimonas flava TaxID=2320271 RepID=A0A3A1WLQ0_9HYPH|nr:hypothetical protein [Aureimonas flava]RIY02466.1 hypothetical protein D3218_03590 [Aureimonas flava]